MAKPGCTAVERCDGVSHASAGAPLLSSNAWIEKDVRSTIFRGETAQCKKKVSGSLSFLKGGLTTPLTGHLSEHRPLLASNTTARASGFPARTRRSTPLPFLLWTLPRPHWPSLRRQERQTTFCRESSASRAQDRCSSRPKIGAY